MLTRHGHLFATATCLILAACTSSGGPPRTAPPLRLGEPGGLPAFAALRAGAALTETLIYGKDTELRSALVSDNGNAAELIPAGGGFEWAIYRFNTAHPLDSLSLQLDSPSEAAYVCLANYATGCWEVSGPYGGRKTFAVDGADYLSPGADLYCAVVASGGEATVSALSVRTFNPANLPPSASLSADVTSGDAPLAVLFNASASTDSDGTIIEYAWDWDGNGGYDEFTETPVFSHSFTTAGLRSVRLRVTDEQFARDSATVGIDVNLAGNSAPVADFNASPLSGDAPLAVSFDATGSTDFEGAIVRYDWDFDGDMQWDSYDAPAAVEHSYAAAGDFTARLRVTDDVGAQDITTVDIDVNLAGNSAPVADFDASPLSGDAPLAVSFDATASADSDGAIVRYDWDFDGDMQWDSYDAPAGVEHSYAAAGDFTARLRVTDDVGAQDIDTADISVNAPGNDDPVADLTVDQDRPLVGQAVLFDASGSSDPEGLALTYEWDFNGDGAWDAGGASATASHTYATQFGYEARVRVTDDRGAQDTAQVQVAATHGPWTGPRHDTLNSGRSPYVGAQTNTFKWSYTAGFWAYGPAVGADGTVYFGSADHKLYALKPDGSLKWSYTAGNLIMDGPALGADGTVYFGCDDNKLYALNPDGSFKWSYTTGDDISSSPAIGADGTVYVGSWDNKLYALNPDGSFKWSYTAGTHIFKTPAIGADGTVYFGSDDFKLHALNPDGSFKWSYTTSNYVRSSPAIGADGTVYFGTYDNKLYALNPDGSFKWSYTTGNDIHSSPAIGADGTVYIGSFDNKLYALNPDGSFKWSYTTGGLVKSSPAIGADGTVYFGSNDNKLYALDDDATLKWSYTTGDDISSCPAIGADGTVYFCGNDSKLHAIGP